MNFCMLLCFTVITYCFAFPTPPAPMRPSAAKSQTEDRTALQEFQESLDINSALVSN